jgi:hypothetical protein
MGHEPRLVWTSLVPRHYLTPDAGVLRLVLKLRLRKSTTEIGR